MTFHHHHRRGFALVVALAALVIIGGLIVGVLFASTQEYRIGRNSIMQSRALTAAEYGMNLTLSDSVWQSAWNNVTQTDTVLGTYSFGDIAGGGLVSTRVVSLGNGNFMLVSEGRVGAQLGAQARERIGAFVTLHTPQINLLGAVTTRGGLKITGSSQVQGEDTPVAEWGDCPPAGDPMPGVTLAPGTDFSNPCADKGCITGDPPVAYSDSADDIDTYTKFGDMDWDQLAALASKTVPNNTTFSRLAPSFTSGGACNTGDLANWGDPLHEEANTACQSYFPIIHVTGNLKMTGGAGQGILLVDGNLNASGGVQFYGPVIVKGEFSVTGNGQGARFLGGVMAANVDLADSKIAGNAVVTFSRCALTRALNGSANPRLDPARGWIAMP